MKIYFRKVFLSLGLYVLLTLVGLTLIATINQINLISTLGIRSTAFYFNVSKVCFYMAPYIISIITPLAFLISVLIILYKYRKENYIIALQSFGLGHMQINKIFYAVSCIVILTNYTISFFLAPIAYTEFKNAQLQIRQQNINDMIETNVIKTYATGLTIYVDAQETDGTLKDIFIADTRAAGTIQTFTAKIGRIVTNEEKINLILINGTYNKTSLNQSTFLAFKTYSIFIDNLQKSVKMDLNLDSDAMSFLELLKFDDTLNPNFNKIKTTLHQKLIWPLYSIIFLVICLKFEWLFYYKYYSRTFSNKHVLISIVICMILAITNFIMQNFSLKLLTISTILIYLIPLILLKIVIRVIGYFEKY